MPKLHGNLYDLKNGWYEGRMYNVLPVDGLSLDGHYTIVFKWDLSDIRVFKHGDYGNLVSIIEVEFKGFEVLNEIDYKYIKEACERVVAYKLPYDHPDRKYVGEAIFDYSYDIFEKPVYLDYLK